METKTTDKKLKIAKNILMGLGVAAGVASIVVFPGLAYLAKWLDETSHGNKRKAQKVFHQLKKRGMIATQKTQNKIKIILKPKAKKRIEKYLLSSFEIAKPKKWDGRWWLVTFDVPESRKSVRDLIRRKLANQGFVAIQKSVLVYPYECQKLIENLRDYYKMSPGELYIFEAKVIEGEETLKKQFKL